MKKKIENNEHELNSVNKSNSKKRQTINKMKKRKLDNEFPPDDLNIYLDISNFEETIPNNLIPYKTLFINAMNKAKATLESFIKIYYIPQNPEIIEDIKNSWGIQKFDLRIINGSFPLLVQNNVTNCIFFKFDSLGTANMASSEIVFTNTQNQPIFGVITLNKDIPVTKLNANYLDNLMLHEFIHILGFHRNVIINDDDDTYFEGIIITDNTVSPTKYYLDSETAPKVIDYANKYFGCSGSDQITEIILEIDENNNIHWPSRFFLGELMTKYVYPEEQVLSGFTLSFLEDLGYLYVEKYYTGGLMRFGKNQGYNFMNKNCINSENIKFENDFYYPTDLNLVEPSCSSGRLSKTVHKLETYSTIPSDYIYFSSSPTYGGLEITNYCPVSVSNLPNVYDGLCSTKGKLSDTEKNIFGEMHSDHSFCALNTLVKASSTNYESYKNVVRAGCFNMYCSDESLTIQVGEDYLVCPKSGGKIQSENYDGFILCPDYNLICTTTENNKLCNDMIECINNKVEEKESSFTYSYTDIKTTQDSSAYNSYSVNTNDCHELAASGGKCPQFCSQCNEIMGCFKCRSDYSLIGQNENNQNEKIKCEDISANSDEYYSKNKNSYSINYKCIEKMENCLKCSDGNTCTECIDNRYKIENNLCLEKIQNCEAYNADDSCNRCKNNYELIKGREGETSCMNSDDLTRQLTNNYYYKVNGDPNYYVKCSDDVDNCEKCDGYHSCIKCINNNNDKKYAIIGDDKTECKDLSTNKYFLDTDDKYKLCEVQLTQCEKCLYINNILNCLECNSDAYVLAYGDKNECKEKTSIENDEHYYTKDGFYYSCNDIRYNDVENCEKCNEKETCISCKSDFLLFNSNKLCVTNADLIRKKYYEINGIFYLCSEKIKGCERCDNENKCIECNIAYDLDDNDKCIPTALSMTRYYLDITTKRYKSCSIINNCEECSSATVCTKCTNGYELNDGSCEKQQDGNINNNNNNNGGDDKTKSLSIGAIVLGSISIVVSIVAIVLILIKIVLPNNKGAQVIDGTQSVKVNNEEPEEIVIKSNKRSISNNEANKLNNES